MRSPLSFIANTSFAIIIKKVLNMDSIKNYFINPIHLVKCTFILCVKKDDTHSL